MPHELATKPSNYHVWKLIEDKVWERHLLGFNSLNLDVASLDSGVLEDLKARYKNVKYSLHNWSLHLEW